MSNPVMSSECAWLSRRERYQIIAFSSKVSVFGTLCFCRLFISSSTDSVPRGTGSRAKTSLSFEWSSSCQWVDGRRS